jgi:CheY-like chemotaxis protein
MSAVLGIITSHGGALQLFSQTGQGTTFKVYFPIQTSESAGDKSPQHVPLTPWQGSGTILLVEDEEQIRLIAQTLLIKLGFTVIEASNGKEALELYQKNSADITIVITDMGMPVMDGYELFRELKKLRPELPIIISSGFGEVDVASKISRDEIAGIISKPYTFDTLRETLQHITEGC